MKRPTDRSRLETLREFNRKLLRLCGLATEIAKLGDERATLRTIVDTAASLIGVDGAHLALVDRGERTLYGVASSGGRARGARTLRVDLSRSAAAQEALRNRRPVSIASARDDARVNRLARKVLSIGSITYLPLLSGAQSFGLLILISRQPRAWSKMDRDLARHFASFASVALENLRLLNRLAETEGRFRSLVEHIPAIVYICDVEPPYATIYVSPQTETMLGYASKQWLDDPGFFMKIIHPEDVKSVVDHDAAAVKSSGFATTEYRLLDRWGAIRWVRDESVLVRDPAGEPVGWHGVLVEITGIKRAEPPSAAGPIGVGRAARPLHGAPGLSRLRGPPGSPRPSRRRASGGRGRDLQPRQSLMYPPRRHGPHRDRHPARPRRGSDRVPAGLLHRPPDRRRPSPRIHR